MLNEHALHGFFGEVGIDRLTAECVEVFKAVDERGAVFPLCVDDLLDGRGEFGNAFRELADGLFPLLDVRGLVVEEVIDKLDEIVGFGNIFVGNAGPGLVEHSALGRLEDDVVGGVASSELGLDFTIKIVLLVLRLPVAVSEVI